MIAMAVNEKKTPDDSLPDPSELGFSESELEWIYQLWLQWRSLGRPPQISILMKEFTDGYGGVIAGLLQMESIYARVKQQMENQSPNHATK